MASSNLQSRCRSAKKMMLIFEQNHILSVVSTETLGNRLAEFSPIMTHAMQPFVRQVWCALKGCFGSFPISASP